MKYIFPLLHTHTLVQILIFATPAKCNFPPSPLSLSCKMWSDPFLTKRTLMGIVKTRQLSSCNGADDDDDEEVLAKLNLRGELLIPPSLY